MLTLNRLLWQSAIQYADRPALWVDGTFISYGELIQQALDITHRLTPLERPRTAVWADRHFWSYAGIVGTLLAGHAYVPLNPKHPLERLKTILRSADVGALVVDQASLGAAASVIAEAPPMQVIVPEATPAATPCPLPTPKPSDGAYLLFTSGSTGEPKGVMVSHLNVTSYLQTVLDRYAYQPTDRATQLFDLTFDLSVHDMFATWASGGTLYAPSDAVRKAPFQFVPAHSLTCWFSTPATVALMARMRMLRPNAFPSLRLSLFCGEALPKRLAEQWMQAAPNSVVENIYGPTETTIAITAFRLPTNLADLPDVIPIGWPFPGHTAALRGEELLLGGPQVTEGYWRKPALTDERFFWYDGTRMYATGDKAASTSHGFVYLGRLDRQVKIAGYRVELLEVESVLRDVAKCDTVAALAEAHNGSSRIVAVVAEESVADEQIIAGCQRLLPPYMLPSRLVRVREWPLNSNGKTDYRALQSHLVGD